ncbi:MAG: tRNA (adenosine(37)-N6)-threonylcarbamoyltransferase complex transferase subunit TsaD [Bacilli bacterium]
MKNIKILAIETSCDETSCAVVENGKTVLSNIVSSQIKTHTQTGGVIPEIASRLHAEQITYVVDKAIKEAGVDFDEIDAIATTMGPGLVGALLVGIESAKTLSFCYDKPLIGVHHIAGHIYANNIESELKFPLMALVVSGGHTELIYMKEDLNFEVLFKTTDDAIGETFDKVARVLKLPYPGGPHIDRLAKLSKSEIDLNYKYDSSLNSFSYSGLKTAIVNYVNSAKMKLDSINEEDVCYSFQKLAVMQLVDKTTKAIKMHDIKQLVVAGGVAANSYLRDQLETNIDIDLVIPSIKYCTDNAVMIGAVAYHQYLKNDFSDYGINANPNLKLEECYNDK